MLSFSAIALVARCNLAFLSFWTDAAPAQTAGRQHGISTYAIVQSPSAVSLSAPKVHPFAIGRSASSVCDRCQSRSATSGDITPGRPIQRLVENGINRRKHHLARPATQMRVADDSPDGGAALVHNRKFLNDSVRNVALLVAIASTVGASWWFTKKWWKLPLALALPSMFYRLWTTRGDTSKLAEVSASVDMKYVAASEEEQKELHSYMCGDCGYTLFPARGRESAFFTESFKCPMCGAARDKFFDENPELSFP